MPDGMGANDIWRSRILGSALEDTPYQQQAIGGMMGGMQPEQLAALFQSPQVQQQFKSFGIDPQALLGHVRQSPFFSNQFMGQHPGLGGFLNRGLASMAATPEAPMVSGAGSGLSRFAQGAYGGPELLRHYQLQQMMGPMGALAGMLPTYGEQRRRAIEEAIVAGEQRRPGEYEEGLKERALGRESRQAELTAPRIKDVPGGYTESTFSPGAPQGGAQGIDLAPMQGGAPQRQIPGPGGQMMPVPQYGLTPEQQAGWQTQFKATDPELIRRQKEAAETEAQKTERKGRGAAGFAAAAGRAPGAYDKKAVEKAGTDKENFVRGLEREYAPYLGPAPKSYDPKEWAALQKAKVAELENRKQQIYDWYDQQVQTSGGQTVPGRVGGGRPGLFSPGAGGGFNPQEISQHPEMQGQKPGWYTDNQSGQNFYWDGRQVGQPPAAPAAPPR